MLSGLGWARWGGGKPRPWIELTFAGYTNAQLSGERIELAALFLATNRCDFGVMCFAYLEIQTNNTWPFEPITARLSYDHLIHAEPHEIRQLKFGAPPDQVWRLRVVHYRTLTPFELKRTRWANWFVSNRLPRVARWVSPDNTMTSVCYPADPATLPK